MSVVGDLEALIGEELASNITGETIYYGPVALTRVEPETTAVVIRYLENEAERLDRGQLALREAYGVSVYWSRSTSRADRLDQWETIRTGFRENQLLVGASNSVDTVTDSWVSEERWQDGHDAKVVVMNAVLTVLRIE